MIHKFKPTSINNRIIILDILRGIAVFGILLSNILFISGYYLTPYTELENMHLPNLNYGLFLFSFYTIIGKAYPIFCILFGVGLYMQYQKNKDTEWSFIRFFIWRSSILLIIGLLHALIWPGDVVHYYALMGLFLIPIRKLSPRTIIVLSSTVFIISLAIGLSDQYLVKNNTDENKEHIASFEFKDVSYEELKSKVINDGISGMLFINKQQYKVLYAFDRLKITLLQLWGLFLLGIFLYVKGLITGKMYNWRYLIVFFMLGATGKLISIFISYNLRIIEHVFLSLFFITLFGKIYKSNFGKFFMNFISPVGRMALTNYILQSVFAVFIFYGIGLGLYTTIPLYGVYLISLGILIFQVIFSNCWLSRFKYGPMEWLWRTLSYNRNLTLKNELIAKVK